MATAKNLTVIPATFNPQTRRPMKQVTRRRVAGYARVSTDSDEQFTSYEAQVDYYTNYINSNPEWSFVKVYTDEGISGTNTKHRDGFNEMIADALDGRIDLIVTKSVSRFARNTVDSLTTIRKLKEHGTEVYFEKEAIWTFDSKGELLLTIMSSLAQEESRSISENVTWGRRKQFSDGKVSLPYGQFLGYRKGTDGLPEIVPEEAKTVDLIYRMFRNGKSPSYIARYLTAQGIPTPGGKKVWQAQVIESILTNEKYKGDARLQKKFTTDFLTKKQKKNEGEVPQYYVENSHPAIIEPRAWDEVQGIMKRRKASGKRHECSSPFSGIVICGDCGSVYGSKVWHSNDPYRKVIWQCNSKFKNEEKCRTPHVTEERLKDGFLEALSILHENRETLLNDIRDVKHDLEDCTEVNAKITETAHEMEVIAGLIQKSIEDNAVHAQDQEEYNRRYNELADHYEKLKNKLEALEQERDDREYKSNVLSGFLFEMTEFKYLDAEFTDARCIAMLDHVTIYADGRMIYSFLNGSDITVML